jgi:hypothetical protein
MKHKNLLKVFLVWVMALAATTALLFLLRGPAPAHADSPHHVASDCTGVPTPCHTSIQDAVDAASPGDEIRVEQGRYTGVHLRGGVRQVVYISKTVTIRGGYDNSFQHSFPMTQPTVVDAEGAGRVIYITGSSGNISPTVEGLWITGGNASNALADNGWGGGIYSRAATPVIANNVISHNVAYTSTSSWGYGGGIYIVSAPGSAIISSNQVISNAAGTSYYGEGGGLYVIDSPAAQVINNVVLSNTAAVTGGLGHGGGIGLHTSSGAIMAGNRVEHNVAQAGLAPSFGSEGGGIYCSNSNDVVFSDNVVRYNTTSVPSNGQGGGIGIWDCDRLAVVGNTLQGNVGSAGTTTGGGRGGGLGAYASRDLIINANRVLSNTAGFYTGWGGGLYLSRNTTFTMTNNIVAGNVATYQGGGLAFEADISEPVTGTLLHNTFAANNQGSGNGRSAVHVNESYVSLILTNNLIYSHTYGIIVAGGSTAQLYSTLFYANGTDTSGAGSIVNTNPLTGQDPLLDGDYHLQADSPAINVGVDVGVSTDIDGDLRDSSPDIGADERAGASTYLPIVLKNH